MSSTYEGLRVALAQINPRVGDVDANTAAILKAIERAKSAGADLAVFSELAIVGYPPRDLLHRPRLLQQQFRALDDIAAATDDSFAVCVGLVEKNTTSVGHRLHNSAAFLSGGTLAARYAKRLLPTYDVFEERRYFQPGAGPCIVTWNNTRIGLSVCEDAWTTADDPQMPDYGIDPIAEVVDAGAEVVLNLSASPFGIDKGKRRTALLAKHCRRHGCPLLMVNQVGANDELIFDGRSLAIDAHGETKARLAEFEEDFLVVDISDAGELAPRDDEPIRPVADSRSKQARDALVVGIRDYLHKSNFQSVLLGLSGGIDSSVGAVLAADALGAENVRGVSMPSKFSTAHGREDARTLAENLGIRFDEIPIQSAYSEMVDVLEPRFSDPSFGVAHENIQARIRGVYLMALSNDTGDLVLATGNKSELAVGYCTLYGDMCGALAIIGDLSKMLVYEIAELYNDETDPAPIPKRVLEKAPSAELRPDQKDADSLPSYEILDEILERYLVDHQTVDQIVDAGFDRTVVDEAVEMVHRNEYKRWQAPPVLKVTSRAFGIGWRYPLAAKYY